MNIGKIETQIRAIIYDNEEYIKGDVSDYIMSDTATGQPWYYEFLDDSEGECTEENIKKLVKIIEDFC